MLNFMEKVVLKSWMQIARLSFSVALTTAFSLQSLAQNSCPLIFEPSKVLIQNKQNELMQRWSLISAAKKEQIQKDVMTRLMEYVVSVSKIGPLQLMKQKNIRPDQIFDLSESPTTQAEKEMLLFLAQKVETNTLEPFLQIVVTKALEIAASKPGLQKRVAGLTEQQKAYGLFILADAIKSTVRFRGLTSDSNVKHVEWSKYSKMISEVVRSMPGKTIEEKLVHASEAQITQAKEVRLLVDGIESFPLREKLMAEANQSIDVMSWAIYDDKTGASAVDTLIKKHQDGIRVRVVVDGQISKRPGYGAEVTRLEAAGVPVVRWRNPDRQYEGQHRKLIVIDGEHIIAGGLNFGDVYSHQNPDSQHWRDTDMYFRGGSAALDGQKLFGRVWDSQINAQGLKFEKYRSTSIDTTSTKDSDPRLIVIDSRPSDHINGSPILKTILTAIRNANDSIDIENAYLILFPAIKEELTEAVARGVPVRVLTNSTQSVDEPIMALPIIRSAKALAEKGVQLFLKKGSTLHSKILVVDKKISIVKSYNLHPRSEKIEEEMAVVVLDKEFGEHMSQVFDKDIVNQADSIPSADHIQMPFDPTSLLGLRIFFDQL